MRNLKSARIRFLLKVKKTKTCWLWLASVNHYSGYGQFFPVKGFNISAHRWAYLNFVGPVKRGLCVLHKCDNKRCVRPSHLWLGTQAENIQDMLTKDRHWHPNFKGANNPMFGRKHSKQTRKRISIGCKRHWRSL